MQSKASHLSRSRHGVWYFRWRIPADVRTRHPELPKELKRSTKTADTRLARTLAREMYCALLLRYAIGQNMSSPFESFRFSGFTLKRDPVSTRITKISTDEKDTPESLAVLAKLVELDEARGAIQLGKPVEVPPTSMTVQDLPSLGAAIESYSKFQIQSRKWTDNTANYMHLPSLRLFREMVGSPTASVEGRVAIAIDLPLGQALATPLTNACP